LLLDLFLCQLLAGLDAFGQGIEPAVLLVAER